MCEYLKVSYIRNQFNGLAIVKNFGMFVSNIHSVSTSNPVILSIIICSAYSFLFSCLCSDP